MRARLAMLCVCGASALVAPARAQEVQASQASPQPAAQAANRLTLTANGSTLSNADGGSGFSVGWLRYIRSNGMVGVGVEHQSIADASWDFASVNGALTGKSAAGRKFSVNAEIQRGSGEEAGRDFSYSVTAAGVTGAVTDRFSLRFESRWIDVDRSNGNLAELGFTYLWNRRFSTNVAYADSISGNLGTQLVSTRTDYYGQRVKVLFGAAFGDASPTVVNLQPGLPQPGASSLRQIFGGVAKPLERGELLAVADYLHLGVTERVTLTISYTIPLGRESGSNR